MSQSQPADPAVRRRTLIILGVSAAVGALLIFGFTRYRDALLEWIVADPASTRSRVSLVFFISAGLFAAPLVGFAAYLWSFGARVIRTEAFPPPGYRVARETPALSGVEAVQRGSMFTRLERLFGLVALGIWLLLWSLAGLFAGRGV